MCGIAGIYDFGEKAVPAGDLALMAETLSHRGPDDGGFALLAENPRECRFFPADDSPLPGVEARCGFAHRRLSIIDTSKRGVQPMSDESGEVWITYNGEIYNYLELRGELEALGHRFRTRTDTEVLLGAYIEWGISCLDRLNGMWAFAIWDTRRRRLFLARDRFGIKPLYYTLKGNVLVFASEPKALLKTRYVSADPDGRALADYLVHSRVDCFDWTFFRDIKRLQPGCFFDIGFGDGRPPEPVRWWNLAESLAAPPRSDEECAEKFLELFTSSVRLRLRSDVPVGTCLSGGLDSTSVVCVARPWLEEGNQKTFSAVFGPSFGEDESEFIDEVVDFADVENHRVTPSAETLMNEIEKIVYVQDEPFNSTSQYSQFKVFELARSLGTTVTLDGQGADEELAGYHYLFPVHFAGLVLGGDPVRAFREFSAYRSRTGAAFTRAFPAAAAGFLSHRAMIRWANRYDPGRDVSWVGGEYVRTARGIRAPEPPDGFDRLTGRLYELFTVSSLPALLRYEDRNSMAFSVEARLPFMDYRLVSYVFSLPASQKINDGWTKYVLRNATRGVIPESIRTRTDKIGFAVPEGEWFRREMLPFIRDIFDSRTARNRGLYDVPRLLELVDANAAGKVDAGRAVWRALNCELWFRRFVD